MQAKIKFTLEAPCDHPNGLDWDRDDTFWLVCGNKQVFKLSAYSGEILCSLKTPGHAGVMYDGVYLWVVDSPPPKVYKVNPQTGEELDTLDPTGPVPIGLAWDGNYIWCGEHNHGICKIDPKKNQILAQYKCKGDRTHDLAWDGKTLWFVDTNQKMFYQMDVNNGEIMQSFPSPDGIEPHGLTWDGQTLWFSESDPNRIHKLKIGG